jgi:hypothetical protein
MINPVSSPAAMNNTTLKVTAEAPALLVTCRAADVVAPPLTPALAALLETASTLAVALDLALVAWVTAPTGIEEAGLDIPATEGTEAGVEAPIGTTETIPEEIAALLAGVDELAFTDDG